MIRHPKTLLLAVLISANLAPSAMAVRPVSFVGLGDLAGGGPFSEANAVSQDGSVVVGYSVSGNGAEAFRWTAAGGMLGLGDLAGDGFDSRAYAVSPDGGTVVGTGNAGIDSAFRWTFAEGMVHPAGLPTASSARGVSGFGTAVVGYTSTTQAYRWTSSSVIGLGTLPGGSATGSAALAITPDGSVIVGSATNAASQQEAFRWTQAGGMVGLGDLPGPIFSSNAAAVSADGLVVVGGATPADTSVEAFRWTQAAGMVGLGHLPGGTTGFGLGASLDGSVIVGFDSAESSRAFIWRTNLGMVSLEDYLSSYGLPNLAGWELTRANGITPSGRIIVGAGINPNGIEEGWIAEIPTELPGDVNVDGTVDIFDVNLVSSKWGTAGPTGDANYDSVVNIFDINFISANWTHGGSGTAVPEPSSLGLGLIVLISLAVLRWRHRRWGGFARFN